MSQPKISIIVPVYNVEKYIRRCIDSVLSQTYRDFECIIVDDCSPDKCPEICDEYAKQDSRIKVIHKTQNEGLPQARKTGFENSSGEYILHIDSDDWIEIDMAEKLHQKAISENYDITICDFFIEKDGITNINKQDFCSFNKIDIIKKILSIRIKAFVWNKLVKRELYSLVEFPEYSRSEDYVITIQNIYNANKIGYIKIPLYHYCFNTQSLSNNIETKISGCIEENRNWHKVINYLKDKYGDLKIFEPELSTRINSIKYTYISDKELKNVGELFELYPESNFFRWQMLKKIKKIIKLFLPDRIKKMIR